MTEPNNIECVFCGSCVPVDACEGFPKFAAIDDANLKSYIMCRDCFEIAYRGADEDHRHWNISAQSIVLA